MIAAATLTHSESVLRKLDGAAAPSEPRETGWDADAADLRGYPHYMLKEIGPIALVDARLPIVVIMTQGHDREKTLNQVEEIKARGGRIVIVANHGDREARCLAEDLIEVPVTMEELAPITNVIPLQRLAYEIAVLRNLCPDDPQNLARSATVE